jgi:hypothetical protein
LDSSRTEIDARLVEIGLLKVLNEISSYVFIFTRKKNMKRSYFEWEVADTPMSFLVSGAPSLWTVGIFGFLQYW